MTDDNKEFIFNSITQWLRDSNFIISEEKVTVVTSEFYAKAILTSDQEHILEIVSSSGIETRFMLRVRVHVSEQQLEMYESLEPKEKLTLDDKTSSVIYPQGQSFVIKDIFALLEKIASIEPKSIDAKHEFLQNVLNLFESARRLEINFKEFFSNHTRKN
ncbi:hypothetical protein [Candidatus Nitrosocosmicus arcticus]|nr:hypothetical protein [Candidatus Nitrosocosmicus arcticus]